MKTKSIIRRATAIVLTIELLCGLGFALTAILHERLARLRALDVTLQGRSDSLAGAIRDAEDPEDKVIVDPEEFSPQPGELFAVYDTDGKLVGASQESTPILALQLQEGFRSVRSNQHQYRVLQRKAMRIVDHDEGAGTGVRRQITVLYAMRTDHLWHEILEAVRFYLLMSIVLLCLTAVLIVLSLRRLLNPLQELATLASSIDTATLQFSPPDSALHTRELRPLATAITQSIDRLRRAFEMERRFISDAAHEFKTAVAVVRSAVQVLSMRERTVDEYRSGLDRILADNRRVEDLVARMLTLAQSEEKGTPFDAHTDLSLQVRNVLDTLSGFAELRGVSLTSRLEDGVNVRISPEHAEILITNLIMNAIQHSSLGSGVVINLRQGEEPSRIGILEVRDSGSGIAAENLPHVFERFFREDPSRTRETGGAGLGLAICKSIVDSAHGHIHIESEKGKGTRVAVSLPLV